MFAPFQLTEYVNNERLPFYLILIVTKINRIWSVKLIIENKKNTFNDSRVKIVETKKSFENDIFVDCDSLLCF